MMTTNLAGNLSDQYLLAPLTRDCLNTIISTLSPLEHHTLRFTSREFHRLVHRFCARNKAHWNWGSYGRITLMLISLLGKVELVRWAVGNRCHWMRRGTEIQGQEVQL